jgi:hypothetical protein
MERKDRIEFAFWVALIVALFGAVLLGLCHYFPTLVV